MKCNNCGYEYREGDAFCPNCGTATNSGNAAGGNSNPNDNNSSYNYNNNNNNYNNGNYNNGGNFNNSGNYNTGYYSNNNSYSGYNSGGYNNAPKAPIVKRDIVITVILSIVTCGIYGIIWFIQLVDDLNVAADRPDDTSGGMVFLLTIITCGVYGLYWSYTAGEKVNYIRRKYGMHTDDYLGLLYLGLDFFKLSLVTYCLIQSELNKVARD